MQSITPPPPSRHVGSFVVGTVLGGCFVAAGLGIAFLTLETPIASSLVPGSRSGNPPIALGIWALARLAGGALLVAGTNRLAAIVADIRSGWRRPSPLA